MSLNEKILVVIVGPTAVGKTDLAFDVAKRLDTEILSADSRQFYRELELGTAKPARAMLEEVRHHFINSLSITQEVNAGQFEREALAVLEELFTTKDVAVMVGGSGLYVQALCEGMDEMPEIGAGVREKWNESVRRSGLEEVSSFVRENDPEFYQIVDKRNHVRLIRAAEVIESTGRKFSSFRKHSATQSRDFRIIKIGLNADRKELYQRIDLRMEQMIEAGLFEEAANFFPQRHLQSLHTLGYQEIFGYLQRDYDKTEAIRLLKRNSRRYAKRQLTWFGKDKEIQWFDRQNISAAYAYLREAGVRV